MAQIKKDTSLRKAILQAAITGQLISSCHSELDSESAETGKELLDKIIEERNNKLLVEWEETLKKNPKAKRPAPVVASEIDEEEIPFEIPENWSWCRLGDICIAQLGKTLDKVKNKGDEVPYLCSINVNWGKIDLEKIKTLKLEESEKQKYLLKKGDLLICEGGDVGRSAIWNSDEIMYYQNALHRVRFFLNLNQKYFYYVLFQYKNLGFLDAVSKGMTIKHLVQGALLNLTIPLPPLSVQNAIVEILEQVLPLVDAYENAILQKEELKGALPDKVKKAILQEAITGKLTEAWRKSATIKESGKQLLDRIIEERNAKAFAEWEEALKKNPKAKKPAAIIASEIEEEDIPFEVPESWCWVKGKNIFATMESIKPQGETFTYIDTDAVNNKLNIIDNPKNLLVKDAPSRASRKLHKGDVLFSMVRPYLKNIAFVEDAFADAIASTGFYVMTQIGMYNPKFLYYMVLSPYVIDGLHYFMKGDNSPSINTTDVDNFVYPLPPLEEQEEIVRKVEELFPLCK